jgi:hypothetical protein
MIIWEDFIIILSSCVRGKKEELIATPLLQYYCRIHLLGFSKDKVCGRGKNIDRYNT